jgi:eukaryotic-like serine/threonine-protein kinase
MRPQVGEVINGKYRLVRLIGEGGMGAVYEARHEYLGSAVALKFLDSELARRPGLVARFLQEARVSASIRSPHVVQVSDVDQSAAGLPYLVMELLEGESLQRVVSRSGKLPVETALDFAVQILNGLEAAHGASVVHRDLKPDNVFVVPTRQGPLIKLLDFGIAKLRISDEFQRGLTRPGVLMGTPEYMAPEQAFSADTVDLRADIYSLGVMLFEMLTGRRPMAADDPRIMAAAVLAGKAPSLNDVDPSLPAGLSAILQRALAGRINDRFPSAEEMRGALAPFCRPTPNSGLEIYGSSPQPPTPAPQAAAAFSRAPGSPMPTAPESDYSAGVPPTLPPSDTPVLSTDGSQTGRTGTVLGGAPNVAGYGSTAQMSPYGYGAAAHTPAAVAQPLYAHPQPARVSRSRGVSIGIVAAVAGALAVVAAIAVVWVINSGQDGGDQPKESVTTISTPAAPESVIPVDTNPPTTAPPQTVVPPVTPAHTQPTPITTAARQDAGAADGGAEGDSGAKREGGLPFPLPSQLPSSLPFPLPSFPIPIPGFPH